MNIDANRLVGGRWPANAIVDEDVVAALDKQSGVRATHSGKTVGTKAGASSIHGTKMPGGYDNRPGDSGGASRFFFCPRVGRTERKHPTQKPVALTTWLASLLLVPGGRLLVPYAGVGSEMVGAQTANWDDVLGIEQDAGYVAEARQRLA